jgi:hypothetical protein
MVQRRIAVEIELRDDHAARSNARDTQVDLDAALDRLIQAGLLFRQGVC